MLKNSILDYPSSTRTYVKQPKRHNVAGCGRFFIASGAALILVVFGLLTVACEDSGSPTKKPPTLEKIEVSKEPDKLQYELDEEFDPDGIEVTAHYSDNSTNLITNSDELTFSGFDSSAAVSDQKITVTYQGKEDAFYIDVSDGENTDEGVTVTGIEVGTNPTKTEYIVGEDIDLAGMVLHVDYSDGESGNLAYRIFSVNPTFDYEPKTAEEVGELTITIHYRGAETELVVEVTEDDGGEPIVEPPEIPLTGLRINHATLTVLVGHTTSGVQLLSVTPEPTNATQTYAVTWSSSDAAKATVAQTGAVTGVAVGNATITATVTGSSPAITATCAVTVTDQEVPLTGLTINHSAFTLVVGDTNITLAVTPVPVGTTDDYEIEWESSDDTKATVTANATTGVVTVTGVAAGEATITATVVDSNPPITAECTVTVVAEPIPLTGITLSKTTLLLAIGAEETLTVSPVPADATDDYEVEWESSDLAKATVTVNATTGVVTVKGIASGTAKITATATVDGTDGEFTAECNVTVSPPLPGDIEISPATGAAFIDTTLTAAYSGDETVTYQWNKDGTAIDGATEETYKPTAKGSYTVTVSAEGFAPKTSAAVVIPGENSFTIDLAQITNPAITLSTIGTIHMVGATTSPQITVTGAANATCRWLVNDVDTGVTTSTITLDATNTTYKSALKIGLNTLTLQVKIGDHWYNKTATFTVAY